MSSFTYRQSFKEKCPSKPKCPKISRYTIFIGKEGECAGNKGKQVNHKEFQMKHNCQAR